MSDGQESLFSIVDSLIDVCGRVHQYLLNFIRTNFVPRDVSGVVLVPFETTCIVRLHLDLEYVHRAYMSTRNYTPWPRVSTGQEEVDGNHAPRGVFSRLEAMILIAGLEIPTRVILQRLACAIKIVPQVSRLQDGSRKIVNISEVIGIEVDHIAVRDIFHFRRIGGITLPPGIFDEVSDVNMQHSLTVVARKRSEALPSRERK